jgi:DnaK suppressor protein
MNQKEQIKSRIEEELVLSQKSFEKLTELTKPIAPDCAIGRVSRMDAINNRSVNLVALKNIEIKLNNLKVALTKIEDADFGICVRCHNPIPLGRVLLMPQVTTCVNCSL